MRFPGLLILVLSGICCFAQREEIVFEHFSGLPAPVRNIVQDTYGFLWMGTSDGLIRYDGKKFITFRNATGDTSTIPNNIINALSVDEKGRVWVATNSGLCYYDFADGIFHNIHFQSSEKIDRFRIHSVATGKNGDIWFATKSMLHLFHRETGLKEFPLPFSGDLDIRHIYVDSEDRVWVGANNNKLFLYEQDRSIVHQGEIVSPFSRSNGLTTTIHPLIYYKEDTLLAGTWYAGLQKVSFRNGRIQSQSVTDTLEHDPRKYIVTSMARAMNSELWLGTYGNGMAIADFNSCTILKYVHHDPANAGSLSSDYINVVFTDASGIIWIGTSLGLDKYDPYTRQFHNIPLNLHDRYLAVYRTPSCILSDRNDPSGQKLWVTISGVGLLHYNRETHHYKIYEDNTSPGDTLTDRNIYTAFYDSRSRLWLGMRTGVCQFDPANGRFRMQRFPGNRKVSGIHIITEDKSGRLWFGSFSEGMYCYDEAGATLINYRYEAGNRNSLRDDHVFCLLADKKGRMWAGTQSGGLSMLDPETGKFLHFSKEPGSIHALPDNGVFDVHMQGDSVLWIATENGLAKMNLADNSINIYNRSGGLCNNDVFSITEDKKGRLWLATNGGLSMLDPFSGKFRNYYIQDGLPVNSISGAVCCLSDGTIMFGTNSTISYFHPDKMKVNKNIPPVVITDFRIYNEPVTIGRKDGKLLPINLNHSDNMISFDFAALNFSNPGRNTYAYKLEGFDKDWIPCGDQQTATYTNLDGGKYIFRVIAANNDGVWNDVGASVSITVQPPYWKSWWFYALAAACFALIIYSVYRIRLKQIMNLQKIRLRISRDLHDDIGSTLSSINMMSAMAVSGSAEDRKNELFTSIRSASQQAIELMSDIVWSVSPDNDKISNLAVRLREYAAETLEAANISFSLEINIPDGSPGLPMEKRKDFYLIYKEAVNNCAKYSKATHADIRISLSGRMFVLQLTDNGCGFDAHSIKRGNGLINMKMRARQLKGMIYIHSSPDVGTDIRLEIPFIP